MSITTEQVSEFIKLNGDFVIYDMNFNYMIYNGANVLNKLKLWNWIKSYDPDDGFMFSEHENTNAVSDELYNDDHTAITFAITMRYLQRIANVYLDKTDTLKINKWSRWSRWSRFIKKRLHLINA